jgi:hypothetical protein
MRRLAGLCIALALVLSPAIATGSAGDAYSELAAHEDAQDARIAALEAKVAALSVTPTPTASPTPTPSPSPSPVVTPSPTASPTPSPTPAACPANLQTAINAAPAGATLNLTGCTFTSRADVTKPLTLIGGTITDATNGDGFTAEIAVGSDDVVIDGLRILDGGAGVAIYAHDRVTVKNSTFRGLKGGAVAMWGDADDITIEGNDILQTEGMNVSPIDGRASEGSNPCPVVARRTVVRNNVMDQGPQGKPGWFGIELKCHEDVLIERNTLRGGHALISLPDNNRVVIRRNRLTLGPPTTGAYWGVEIANDHDVTVTDNDCVGTTQTFGSCVSMNTAPLRTVVTFNRALQFVHFLVQGGGGGLVITDNCYSNLLQKFPDPSDTLARNVTPCP